MSRSFDQKLIHANDIYLVPPRLYITLIGCGLQILVQWFQQQAQSGQRVAFMLPLYYLQRSRIAEALHAYTALKDGFAGNSGKHAALL